MRLLLADSTNAEEPGFIPSESTLAHSLYELVVECRGRVIAACFASHLHRVQQIVEAAVDCGRYVAFLGRSMQRNVAIAEALGTLRLPADAIIPMEEVLTHPAHKMAVVCTGSQGEPFAALSLMAAGDHRWVKIEEGDTVLISARPIPGNETRSSRVINGLLRLGARVFHGNNAPIHVSGHGAQEELRTFLNVVRPQAFVPVHGEYRHLSAHAALARQMKVPEVVVCEDGDRLVLDGKETRVERQAVPGGHVYVDGLEVAGGSGGHHPGPAPPLRGRGHRGRGGGGRADGGDRHGPGPGEPRVRGGPGRGAGAGGRGGGRGAAVHGRGGRPIPK